MFEKLKSFHLSVERFFEERKREATLGRALGAWLLVVLLLGLFSTVFGYSSFDLFLLALKYKFSLVLSSFVGHAFSFAFFTLLAFAGICLALRVSMTKTSLLKLFYGLNVSTLLACIICFALVLLFAVSGVPTGFVLFLANILTLYLVLTVLKTFLKTTWSNAFGLFAVAGIISFVAYLICVNVYLVYAAHNYAVKVNSGLVLKDSFQLVSENGTSLLSIVTQNGERCSIQFPGDWRFGEEKDANIFFAGKRWSNFSDTKNRVIFEGESFGGFNQRMAILDVYPVAVTSSNKKTCEENWKEHNEEVIQKMRENGFQLSNYTSYLYEEHLLETCDAEFINENNSETRHIINARFLNGAGIDVEYSSKTKNSDLQYIMKNFECN